MLRRTFYLFLFLLAPAVVAASKPAPPRLRPVAVPLVVVDPYFSIWSFADHLTYEPTRHWTGTRMTMQSIVRVDGKSYRIMGDEPRIVAPAEQTSLRVFPTRTVYEFQASAVRIQLTFLTPDLPQDVDALSRPITYLVWQVSSTDGRPHQVEIYYDNSAELVVNTPDQQVDWKEQKIGDLDSLRMGTADQPVLGRSGDSVRIDWGYLYAAAPRGESPQTVVLSGEKAVTEFVSSGALSSPMDTNTPRAANDHWPVMAVAFHLGAVNTTPVSRHILLAYDEIYPIEFLHHRLRPYWHRSQRTIGNLLQSAEHDFPSLSDRSRQFDENLMADLTRVGGEEYAEVAALAYRQAFGANKLASGSNGSPRMFLKEISSCGCAQTADVIYPESPILLLLNPKLLEYSLIPLIEYAQSGQWPYSYAPHDLGTYPIDDGRVAQRMESMPVEESGNMLLMIAGIAKAEGNADFAAQYWPLLSKWADYLKANGLDPGNQLCTDDFTGLLAHNSNLSLKAIVALGGYAMMARMLGKASVADDFERTAKDYAQKWLQLAADGDHTRLAFDRPGTWSEKYNLIWDRVLGLNLFPPSLAKQELAFYSKRATPFGFPLDSRTAFTKLDWESWSAALATSKEQFVSIFRGMYGFADASPTRVPLSDWYWTTDGTQTGFQARPVVGGIFMEMLTDPAIWKKWAITAGRTP
ncbi:MAG: glutaminase domain-containing protein [Candidatus Acidiferrales bacterium]